MKPLMTLYELRKWFLDRHILDTLPETNIAPEKGWLED